MDQFHGLVRYGSHNLHDFKWTNPCGEKLARRFGMLRTQQYLIPNFVDFLYTTLVRKSFLSLLRRNQTSACKAERRLQTLNKSSRRCVTIVIG
jgi:hypothetical protein